jgi:hypothetical protein
MSAPPAGTTSVDASSPTAATAAAATAGALLGALAARLAADLWPLPGAAALESPAYATGLWWLWSPVFPLAGALVGALALLLVLGRLRGAAAFAWPAASFWPAALAIPYLVQPLRLPLWGGAALLAAVGGLAWLCKLKRPLAAAGARPRWAWLGDALVFALALALYVATLAPSVLPGDSGEFQLVAPTLGIPHPTGYPLYLLLGKGISLLPVGNVAYRLNLLSALAAAGTVWAVYRVGRALGLRQAAALAGAGLLAVSQTLWSQATIAEKYTLNAFLVALTLLLGLKWRRVHRATAGRASRGWLYAWAACYGLSLTHHRTMLLLAPAYLLLVWFTDRRLLKQGRLVVSLLGIALAPLALYLLLPLLSALNPPYAYTRIDSARAFFDLVLARDYQGSLFRGGWSGLWPRLGEAGRLLARQYGWPGLVVALGGWGVALRRSWRIAVVLLLGMAAQFAFAANYYVPNTYVYYLPVYVWLAACAAVGVDAALRAVQTVSLKRWAARKQTSGLPTSGLPTIGLHLALACVLLTAAWGVHLAASRWTGMDQRRAYPQQPFGEAYARRAARVLQEGALVVGDWMPATVLWYAQYVEGWMPPGVQVTVADPLDALWQAPVEAALAAGRPVYLARPVMAAGDRYPLSSAGPLVRVLGERHFAAPELAFPVSAEPDLAAHPEIVLLGANLSGTELAAGDTLHADLVWQARAVPQADYSVRVRWVDASGRAWTEQQNRHPVGGSYPTSRWQPGEVVADSYTLSLPAYLDPGPYRLQAALVSGVSDPAWITVAALDLNAAPGRIRPLGTQLRRAFVGGCVLTGYQAPQEWVSGETAALTLQWLACPAPGASRPAAWRVDRQGVRWALEPEARTRDVDGYRFLVDEELAYVEVRAAAPGGLGASRFRLPVSVSNAPPGANFGNLVRLRQATYGAAAYRPGETVRLTLEWQAMQAMDEAFKVFVHVLGPDGLPVVQQDNEPLNGTYPTTRWQPGERVSDPYAIALPADLPPGEYAVEVGLYRISDLTRLPVLDAGQNVVDDKLYIAPLVVQ